MLAIQQLSLFQFRNYVQKQFDFTHRVVGIVGPNGTGKTNILDAIYYLSFTKSYFNRPDVQNVLHNAQGMRIDGNYLIHDEKHQYTCVLRENNKKEFFEDQVIYTKLSQHIGKIPAVMIAPDDVHIISGSSEERRKWIDSLLSQLSSEYLQILIQYNKVLAQRNSLLKQHALSGQIDLIVLNALNLQLVRLGESIYLHRNASMEEILPSILTLYKGLAGQDDAIQITYQSSLHKESFANLLEASLKKDLILQRTTEGIHKDDLIFTINHQPFKQEASQGQRKSLLFAMRIGEWNIIKNKKGQSPILLMDDIFEKLDENRMYQLLELVANNTDGQVFITDTHKERVAELLGKHLQSFQLISL